MGVCKPASSQGIPDSNGIRGRQHGFDCGHDASVVEHPNLAFGELGFRLVSDWQRGNSRSNSPGMTTQLTGRFRARAQKYDLLDLCCLGC